MLFKCILFGIFNITKKKNIHTLTDVPGSFESPGAAGQLLSEGIEQASKHVLMAALCYNLKKYMKFVRRTAETIVMEQSMIAFNALKRIETRFYKKIEVLLVLNNLIRQRT